jgi:hypothetical protein
MLCTELPSRYALCSNVLCKCHQQQNVFDGIITVGCLLSTILVYCYPYDETVYTAVDTTDSDNKEETHNLLLRCFEALRLLRLLRLLIVVPPLQVLAQVLQLNELLLIMQLQLLEFTVSYKLHDVCTHHEPLFRHHCICTL